MAFLEFNYYSNALLKRVMVNVLLPEANKKSESVGIGCRGYGRGGQKLVYRYRV